MVDTQERLHEGSPEQRMCADRATLVLLAARDVEIAFDNTAVSQESVAPNMKTILENHFAPRPEDWPSDN